MENRIKQIKTEIIDNNLSFSFFDEKDEIIMQNNLSDEEKNFVINLMRRSVDFFECIWSK